MSAILAVRVVGDASSARRALEQTRIETESLGKSFETSMTAMRGPALAAAGALAAGAAMSVKAASDQEQALGALGAVFADSTAEMTKQAQAAAAVGLSTAQYAQQAAVLGAGLRAQGITQDKLADSTSGLMDLAADMAAQWGGDTTAAVEALGSMLRGELDPIEKYGVQLKAADVAARMAADGSTEAAAKIALLTESLEQTGTIGAAARETDTFAAATGRAKAEAVNAAAALGDALLPAAAGVADVIAGLTQWVRENTGVVKVLAGVVAIWAGAVLLANGALIAWNATQNAFLVIQRLMRVAYGAWLTAQWALNVALNANPLGLIIIAIAAFVAAIVIAYQKSETFRDVVKSIGDAIRGVIDWIGRMIDKLKGVSWPDWLPGDQSRGVPRLTGTPRGLAVAGDSGGVTINLQAAGWLDPEGTARAVRRALIDSEVRNGRLERSARRW